MSKYYGMVTGGTRKHPATSRGHHGITTCAASYEGAIKTEIVHERETGRDRYIVKLIDWPSKNTRKIIAEGYLDAKPRKAHKAKSNGVPCSNMREFDAL